MEFRQLISPGVIVYTLLRVARVQTWLKSLEGESVAEELDDAYIREACIF